MRGMTAEKIRIMRRPSASAVESAFRAHRRGDPIWQQVLTTALFAQGRAPARPWTGIRPRVPDTLRSASL